MSVVLGNFVALSLDAVNGKISGQNPELLKYQFLILNLMCVKHRSWKQENEFRILFPYPRLRENGKRVDLKDIGLEISAIYLGKDCSIRNQNRLKGVSINLGHLPMIFDAKWQNFCVRKIPMPMPVQAQGS